MVDNRNDCKRESLKDLTGLDVHINEMFLEWLHNGGATSTNIMDAQAQFLTAKGIAEGPLNDRWLNWLGGKGHTGSLADRWRQYWCSGGDGGVTLPAFKALDGSPDVQKGIGGLATFHNSTHYALNESSGLYESFGTNVPVWVNDWLQYYHAATNEMLNSGDVGTETITVGVGTWSINCLVENAATASCIVTAGTATATGYGTATPGSLIELDVTVGGTITIENTGDIFCCNLINKSINDARGLGPIPTTAAAVSTDTTKYEFDIVNDNNQNSAWFFEVNEATVIDTSACMNTGTTSNPFQFLAGNDTIARSTPDGTLSRDRTTVRGIDVTNKVAGIFSVIDSKTILNINGVYANELSGYAIGYSSLDFITVGRSSAGGDPLGAVKYRNLRRYDIASYAEGRDIIDGLMA